MKQIVVVWWIPLVWCPSNYIRLGWRCQQRQGNEMRSNDPWVHEVIFSRTRQKSGSTMAKIRKKSGMTPYVVITSRHVLVPVPLCTGWTPPSTGGGSYHTTNLYFFSTVDACFTRAYFFVEVEGVFSQVNLLLLWLLLLPLGILHLRAQHLHWRKHISCCAVFMTTSLEYHGEYQERRRL